MPDMEWTAERDAVLARLMSSGLPASTAAVALGMDEAACATRWRAVSAPKGGERGWTPEEDASLAALAETPMTWSEIAERMPGRSKHACRKRAYVLGVSRPPKPARDQAVFRAARRGFQATRRCHDCGKPTSDYRCPACLAEWRMKNGVPAGGGEEPEGYSAFGARCTFD